MTAEPSVEIQVRGHDAVAFNPLFPDQRVKLDESEVREAIKGASDPNDESFALYSAVKDKYAEKYFR